jgi:signal peptidase I
MTLDDRSEKATNPEDQVPLKRVRGILAQAGREGLMWFRTLASAAVYATLIVTFVGQVARVEGYSMMPTLQDQDRLIVNKVEFRGSPVW